MIRIVGGPFDGRELPHVERTISAAGADMPEFLCSRTGGEYQHHVPDGGNYRWIGPCSGVDHDGRDPHYHEPCNGGAS